MTEHPIASPSEGLVLQWSDEWYKAKVKHMTREKYMCTQAALWGADQELEACCEWLVNEGHEYEHVALRDDRRPKPSLKKQALETLCSMQIDPCWINGINTNADLMSKYDIIRRALEQLND